MAFKSEKQKYQRELNQQMQNNQGEYKGNQVQNNGNSHIQFNRAHVEDKRPKYKDIVEDQNYYEQMSQTRNRQSLNGYLEPEPMLGKQSRSKGKGKLSFVKDAMSGVNEFRLQRKYTKQKNFEERKQQDYLTMSPTNYMMKYNNLNLSKTITISIIVITVLVYIIYTMFIK